MMKQLYVENVPTKKSLAQRKLKKQRKSEYLKKSKLTRKEIEQAISGLSSNDQVLYDKILQIDNLFGLYLEYRNDAEKFNKFVKAKAEEFEKQQRSKNKEGA